MRNTVLITIFIIGALPVLATADELSTPLYVKSGTNSVVTVDNGGDVKIVPVDPAATLNIHTSSTEKFRGIISAQHNDGVHSPLFQGKKSRGTELNPQAVIVGDYLGALEATGFDGSNYTNPAFSGFVVDKTVGEASIPTAFIVSTGYKGGNPGRAERMRITSDGNVGIGTNDPQSDLHVVTSPTNALSPIRGIIVAQHTSDNHGADFQVLKSRGSAAVPVIVSKDDFLGGVEAVGFDGTKYINTANSAFIVDKDSVNTDYVPTAFVVYTGYKIGNPGREERMRITSDGIVGIGTSTPTQQLEVNGGVRLNTTKGKPTCDSNARGTFWYTTGSADDALEICINKGGVYSWKTVNLN